MSWSVSRVRKTFCDYFIERGHTYIPSSPVVPHNDPTLLFTNAGMNQFKKNFLGTVDPNTEFGKLSRVVNSQMCIRAGGKQNDLDDVGHDTYHHTFFEMLGSWSFGDYGKKEAIAWAWDLMTRVYGLAPDRLYVTYFGGNAELGLAPDDEALQLWKQHVDETHILPGSMKDNFWEMGDTGPCGPCSEIHYDRIGGRNAAHLVNCDDPMVLELWNLVFMQFDRQPDGSLKSLPRQHVDTGMGLERLTSVLQDVPSNYGTDTWTPLFNAIQKVTRFPSAYDQSAPNTDDVTVAYRVVADHARCVTVALFDGAVPDAVGRGFVIRRIIRRAIRYGSQFLNADVGFLSSLVDNVAELFKEFFPAYNDTTRLSKVQALIRSEEEGFARTWRVGLKHFEVAQQAAVAKGLTVISGEDAFILHDRYGFPVDLTELLAEKIGMTVDIDGFNHQMKSSHASSGRVAAEKTFLDAHQLQILNEKQIATTNDDSKFTWADSASKVVSILVDGKFVDNAKDAGQVIGLITESTNFYAEMGGQIFDTGFIRNNKNGLEISVENVQAIAGYVVHMGVIRSGAIQLGDTVTMQVDYVRRQSIAANHTSTHLLNWCLRRHLQDEKPDEHNDINQKGSLVTADLLRFDFSYNNKVAPDDLIRLDQSMNAAIAATPAVYRKTLPLASALTIAGLRFLPGEGYPDPVTVLSIGADLDEVVNDATNPKWRDYPIELCGGTHLKKLADAEVAVIVSEEALMKGVRRMVVYTRDAARASIRVAEQLERELAERLAAPTTDETPKILSVLAKKVNDSDMPLVRKAALRQQLDSAIRQALGAVKQSAAAGRQAAEADGTTAAGAFQAGQAPRLVVLRTSYADKDALQAFVDAFQAVHTDVGVLALGATAGKALAVASVPAALVDRGVNAVDWIKSACGKGGGKPHAAQAGLPVDALDKAETQAKEFASRNA